MAEQQSDANIFAASTGLALTDADWLDAHFEACRAEYEEIVRSVGIQAGWHVLDVGCGSGGFLPLLADLVGPSGRVSAIDLAPDSLTVARRRLDAWDLPCPVDLRIGSMLSLPFPDDSFDAVWCANVLMYATNAELPQVLAELRRVVRPGGLITAKETDGALCAFYPVNRSHYAQLSVPPSPIVGSGRSRSLRFWFEQAGLHITTHRVMIMERHAPLRPVERQFLRDNLANFAARAERVDLTDAARAFWRAQGDPTDPGCILDRPDFSYCEGVCVVAGQAP